MEEYCKSLLEFSELLKINAKGCDDPEVAKQYWRTVISKSYYSAFHKSKALADKLPLVVGKGSHQTVIDTLSAVPLASVGNNSDCRNNIKRISLYLAQLKSNRVDADYKTDSSFSEVDVNAHLDTIKKVITLNKQVSEALISKAV